MYTREIERMHTFDHDPTGRYKHVRKERITDRWSTAVRSIVLKSEEEETRGIKWKATYM